MHEISQKINILLTDDHKVVRDGIRYILDKYGDYNIIDSKSAKEALIKLDENKIHVLITDISMSGMSGDELVKIVLEKFPGTKIIVLTMHEEKKFIEKLLSYGVHGYILKDCGAEEIATAVETVLEDKFYFSQSASQQLMMKHTRAFKDQHVHIDLSEREIEVLKLISMEYTNTEISEKLFISTRTVESHRRNLMQKIGAKNSIGLVRYAYESGLLND